ncbi:hypothetical protein E2K93_09965 [Thalassotalea sp. HSM 43]|uniref:hypothetical protein n=1 Tax=Thalassotalea sp. HSM 43 TaxID=2552945 RepID=UPI001080B39E|nr:hypothetical protein [Thalassotalea sp. HSM 43]QBY04696.1 hypothetical protein E2K93_09965 [Thalassotalea sp. HSM 43]
MTTIKQQIETLINDLTVEEKHLVLADMKTSLPKKKRGRKATSTAQISAVLKLVSDGLTEKEIGAQLSLGRTTVQKIKRNNKGA